MIPQATIERILDAANIVDVVSEYVTLRRAGANYKGLCPFHDDKTPSFSVSPSRGVCKCFSCGKGGNAVHFIMELEQLTYYEALKFLAKKYGIEWEEKELTPEQRQSISERESLFAVNEWAADYFHDKLLNDIDGRTIGLAYFRSRGFRDDIIDRFKLGFALDKWDNIATEGRKKGFKEDNIVKTGLCYRKDDGKLTDRFRGRVMFPWFNISGKVVAFGGRVLDSRTKGVAQKYVNSPETAIYSKGRELYGLYQAKKMISKEDCVYMVEGYTDVISMHQCGIENVVANSGTALSHQQISLLHRYTNNITLLYDGDEAGIHAALRGTDMLLAEGMNVKILLLPDGDDPDSFARKHNATEFREYVQSHQTDFIIFKANLLADDAGRDPLKRANLTKDIIKSISVIPEEISRSVYIHECAELLGIDEAVLLRETQRDRLKHIEEVRREAEREVERARYLAQKEADAKAQAEGEAPQTGAQQGATAATDGATTAGANASATAEPSAPAAAEGDPHAPSAEELEYLESLHAETPPPFGDGQQTAGSHGIAGAVYDLRRETAEDRHFFGLERMIMRLIVRYGERTIDGEDKDGNPVSVRLHEFVRDELAIDGLAFRTPLYARMLAMLDEQPMEEGMTPSKFFTCTPDIDVSREAADLMSERYKLFVKKERKPEDIEADVTEAGDTAESSEDTAEMLEQQAADKAPEQVVHLMLDYKYAVVKAELKKVKEQLKDKALMQNIDRCMELMERHKILNETQRLLAQRLGDRVVTG